MKILLIAIITLMTAMSSAQNKNSGSKQGISKKKISNRDHKKLKKPIVIYGDNVTLKEIMKVQDPIEPEKRDENYVYSSHEVEIRPEFSRNSALLSIFLKDNLKYSQEMKDNNVQGDVLSSFVVEADGTLSNIKIQQGLGIGTDQEVLRLLQSMPKWQPASLNGNNVKSLFTLSIHIDATK